jgi:shikimate kinase
MEKKMEKIFLVGIPNAGKSTLGKLAAEKLNLPYYDTDVLLTERIHSDKPADFLRMALNGQFIFVQKKIMIELSHHKGQAIISTGAEIALIPECAALMKKMGIIIHIQRKPEIALAGLSEDKKSSLIMEINGKRVDVQKESIDLYMEEYSQYEKVSDLSLENNGTEDEGLEKLLNLLASI